MKTLIHLVAFGLVSYLVVSMSTGGQVDTFEDSPSLRPDFLPQYHAFHGVPRKVVPPIWQTQEDAQYQED